MLVYTNAVDGRDDEFNDWYNNIHVPDVLEVDGIQAAQRYALEDPENTSAPHRYLAIYEMETEDLPATMATLHAAVGSMTMTEAAAPGSASLTVWTPIGSRAVSKT